VMEMETGYKMKRSSRTDYLRRVYVRYRQASRSERRGILDEVCANCGYHRKYAIRLLNGSPPRSRPVGMRRPRAVHYGPQVISILKAVWEAADYPWSVRLKALLPVWMPWIRRLRTSFPEAVLHPAMQGHERLPATRHLPLYNH